jgi:hypothetical protein
MSGGSNGVKTGVRQPEAFNPRGSRPVRCRTA